MVQLLIAFISTVWLIRMARNANAKFRNETTLPMQWLLNGEVTWSLPRRSALAFVPGLAIPILTAFAFMAVLLQPRPGQEGFEIVAMLFLAAMFGASYYLHIRMIESHLKRNGR